MNRDSLQLFLRNRPAPPPGLLRLGREDHGQGEEADPSKQARQRPHLLSEQQNTGGLPTSKKKHLLAWLPSASVLKADSVSNLDARFAVTHLTLPQPAS